MLGIFARLAISLTRLSSFKTWWAALGFWRPRASPCDRIPDGGRSCLLAHAVSSCLACQDRSTSLFWPPPQKLTPCKRIRIGWTQPTSYLREKPRERLPAEKLTGGNERVDLSMPLSDTVSSSAPAFHESSPPLPRSKRGVVHDLAPSGPKPKSSWSSECFMLPPGDRS
eukprot:scaffold4060_cov234-Pinguiococcus_pyrenoidosus.AAC.4